MKKLFFLVSILIIALAVWLWPDANGRYPIPFSAYLSQVFTETITPEDLLASYQAKRLKILLVPGHDNQYGGTEFKGVREADLNLALAEQLFNYFKNDSRFIASTTRDFKTGEYRPEFASYFTEQREAITSFRLQVRQRFASLLQSGAVKENVGVSHNFAKEEVSIRLYGINKWANENDIDLVLHLHFNDYPGRLYNQPGKHSGFSIYVPEAQYPNSRASKALGESVATKLRGLLTVSTLPGEMGGVIEDQELIAIGSQGSREGTAFLVEYGYIYESQFINPAVRAKLFPELAWQTYLGIKDYFADRGSLPATTILPYRFQQELREGLRGSVDALALQRLLQLKGFYPPAGESLINCPINGNFGPCVKRAVLVFQTVNNLPATGEVSGLTLTKLNITAI